MAILITFDCGHTQEFTGNETTPTCRTCPTARVAGVDAPMPSFRGHVRGPHAEFKDLPAEAVTFGAKTDG